MRGSFHRVQNIITPSQPSPLMRVDLSGTRKCLKVTSALACKNLTATKKRDTIHQRTGRLKEKCKRVSARYQINPKVDEASSRVTAHTWDYQPKPVSKQTHPKVYKLRTTQITRDDESLWRIYTMRSYLESVFRSKNPSSACGQSIITSKSAAMDISSSSSTSISRCN